MDQTLVDPVDPVLVRRILDILRCFVNPTKFSHLYNGLNVNDDYPRTSRQKLQRTLHHMVEQGLIIRHPNTNAYIDRRSHHG